MGKLTRRHLVLSGAALAAASGLPSRSLAQVTASPAVAPSGATTDSPLVRQLYGGRWANADETQKVYDEFLLHRAVQAYMLTLPALNVIGMRDGSEATFGRGYNVLPIWKDRMSAKTWVTTPNCDVVYSMNYLDLKETGPLVVNAPPNVIGMFTDFFQRTLTDVGAAGPDLGRGGLFLLLPPDYDAPVPGGYHVFRSRTYNVFLFFRTVLAAGPDGPDTTKAVATAEMTRIYPLGSLERNRPPMKFPNASPVRINMMYPTDFSFWEKLKRFIDYEPVGCLEPNVRGMLASLGIIKDVPFNPDSKKRDILTRAVETAARMIFAFRVQPGALPNLGYYTDRQYLNAWGGVDAEFNAPSYQSIDQRASYFQAAYSSAPAMVVDAVGLGSKYPIAIRDADGNLLDGNKSYKLRLPPNIPALLYWAVTIYNPADGTMPETQQQFPSRNQYDNVTTNPDGSVELFFGPSRPAGAPERNWIQTLRDHDFMIAVRLYGTNATFYDQTWKPDDIVKLK
jgi:hypothetical protein